VGVGFAEPTAAPWWVPQNLHPPYKKYQTGGDAVEDKLLGHVLKAHDAETTREVEQLLADDPAAIHNLAQLRKAVAPLEAAREEFEPRADLWLRTLSRVAEHMVATEGPTSTVDSSRTEEMIRRAAALAKPAPASPKIRPAPPVSDPSPSATGRRNIIAMIGLSASVLALVFPVVLHVRQKSDRAACQNSMRQFYVAASDYSDTNNGKFPRVEDGKTAASAAQVLKFAGLLPQDDKIVCPASQSANGQGFVGYAYSLGFRDSTGELKGLDRRPEFGNVPILADAPLRHGTQAVPCNHRHGQNVLFTGGSVQFTTKPTVGVNGDDIFCNANGKVGAGLYPLDSALGRPDEVP